jgi:hypothetical protein
VISSARLCATKGTVLEGVLLNGQKINDFERVELGYPILGVKTVSLRGLTANLLFRLRESTSPGVPRLPVQPLVEDSTPRVLVPTCGG